MSLVPVDAPERLRAFLSADPALHIYALGDLDPAFWPHCRWHAWAPEGAIEAVALRFLAGRMPSLLLLERQRPEAAVALIRALAPTLVDDHHAHLSPEVAEAARPWLGAVTGRFHKMALTGACPTPDGPAAEVVSPAEADTVRAFYDRAYPGHWFFPAQLGTRHYLALRDTGGALLAVGGVHVVAPTEGVAALGNIAVAPEARGQGLGRTLVQHLVARLRATLGADATLGLNVRADNTVAVSLYEGLGFTPVADYDEAVLRAGDGSAQAS